MSTTGLKVDASLGLTSTSESLARLKTGERFTLYTRDPHTGQIRSSKILVFLREGPGYGRAGTLCWSLTNTLTEIPSQKLLLHMILDMRCGKLSPLFTHESMAAKVQDNRCFTLRTAAIELNLEAATHEQRELWWKGILRKLEQAGRQLLNNNAPPATGTPSASSTPHAAGTPVALATPTPSSIHGPHHRAQQASFSSLGSAMGGGGGVAHLSPSSASDGGGGGSVLGTHPSPPPQNRSPAVGPVHESTPEELRSFLQGGVCMRMWTLTPSSTESKESSPASSSSISSNSSSTTNPASSPPSQIAQSTPIVLFAEGRGRSGSLYWIPRDPLLAPNAPLTDAERKIGSTPPQQGSRRRIQLDAITDFILRKKSAPLKACPASSECCFALVYGATGQSLNLEAMTPQECKMAKEAIITMLTTAGKQVIKTGSGASSNSSNLPTPTTASSTPIQVPRPLTAIPVHSNQALTPLATPHAAPPAVAMLNPTLPDDSPLLQGARFLLYTCPPPPSAHTPSQHLAAESIIPSAQEIFLWFCPPDVAAGVDSPGALAYAVLSPPASQSHLHPAPQQKFHSYPGQRFPLASLKQMQIGRECGGFKLLTTTALGQHNAIQVPQAFRSCVNQLLNPQACFSIVFKTGVFHLESLSSSISSIDPLSRDREPVREVWIKALHGIMLEYTQRKKAMSASSSSSTLTPISHGPPTHTHSPSAPFIGRVSPSPAHSSLSPYPQTPQSAPAPQTPLSHSQPIGNQSNHMRGQSLEIPPATPGHSQSSPSPPSDIPHPSLLKGLPFLLYLPSLDAAGVEQVDIYPVTLSLAQDPSTGKWQLQWTHQEGLNGTPGPQQSVPRTQRLVLGTIQRLVAGKTSTLLKSNHPMVKDLPPERCLSIMTRSCTWDLEAAAHEQRENFMRNLHQCMLKFRKVSSAATNTNNASPSPAMTQHHTAATPASSHSLPTTPSTPQLLPAEASDFLSRGHVCRMYRLDPASGEPLVEEVRMWFEPVPFTVETLHATPGILFWKSLDTPGNAPPGYSIDSPRPALSSIPESQRLYLNRMSQLVGGKESACFQHPALQRLILDRCFSIHFAAGASSNSGSASSFGNTQNEWNLECDSHSLREQWIQSIHQVMVRFGREKQEYKARLAAANAVATSSAPQASQSSTPVASSTATVVPAPLAAPIPTFAQATPFLMQRQPTVIHRDSGSSAGGSQSAGNTPVLGSRQAALASVARQPSPSTPLQDDRSSPQPPTPTLRSMDRTMLLHSAASPFVGANDLDPDAVDGLQNDHSGGADVAGEDSDSEFGSTKVFHSVGATVGGTSVLLNGGAGSGGYSPSPSPNSMLHAQGRASASASPSPSESPPLDAQAQMVGGHSPKSPVSSASSSISAGGGGSRTHSQGDAVVASASSSASSTQQQQQDKQRGLETDAASALLRQGQFFTMFLTPSSSSAPIGSNTPISPADTPPQRIEEIFLYFHPSIGSETPGSLFWMPVSSQVFMAGEVLAESVRQTDSSRKFLLNTIKQMRAGKESAILQSHLAKEYSNECCMTLVNQSVTLNLAAKDPDSRDAFMRAVHSIVVQNGMKAREEKTSAAAQHAAAAIASVKDGAQPHSGSSSSAIVPSSHHQKSHSQPPSNALMAKEDRIHRLPSGLHHSSAHGSHSSNTNKTINFSDPTSFFILQQKIGEGSYGSVYKALDLRDQQLCAIKIISFSGVDSTKLRNEIRVLKACNSPHIISYKGAFQKNEYVWIVCQLCAGGSLSDMMLICRHTFSENQISVIMRQTLQGLAYLHSMTDPRAPQTPDGSGKKYPVIHRDIKGANILVTEEGQCMLCDFGVSVSLDASLGKHRTVLGTPHWMAPECLIGDSYNELVDIWSLGITCYELAVGAPPHAELHSLRAALKIPMCEPPTLPNPDRFSPELHSFLKCCLVKDPTRRWTAVQLLDHPFITRNHSSPQILVDMVRKTMQHIESKTQQQGGNDDQQLLAAMQGKPPPQAGKMQRSASEQH